jgi:hypothetical protein
MVTLTTGITFLLFTCMNLWVWEILRRWSTCAPTAYEVFLDYRKFEKHCFKGLKYDVSVTRICLRPRVKPTLLGPTDRASPCLRIGGR